MVMTSRLAATLIGHVEAAVWRATVGAGRKPSTPRGRLAQAAWEAADGFGFRPGPGYRDDLPDWPDLGNGAVDWAELAARPLAHAAQRHVATAALLHAARTGVLGALLAGPVEADEPVLGFGPRDGWCVASPAGLVASDDLHSLAGAGVVEDPAGWLSARLGFEGDWFWQPLGRLAQAGATSGASPSPEAFRAAAARLNALSTGRRQRAARSVGAAIGGGRSRRVLELGAVDPVWGTALAGSPHRTLVDYPAVLRPDRAGVEAVRRDPLAAPPQGRFDVVVIDELLHTAPPADAAGLLEAAAHRLAAGGMLVIVEPLLDDARDGPRPLLAMQVKVALSGGGRLWTGKELVTALRGYGLRPVRPRVIAGVGVTLARR